MENDLVKLVKLDAEINSLTEEIEQTNKLLDEIDDEIVRLEKEDPKSDLLETHAKNYNDLTLKRIGLELRRNKLEHDILLIEYEHAIAE